ncbi:MAG TPA: hypothetical protein VHO47_00290 [Candidatus Babeliales bacterium]|nr:hypothetical protein [Candidatus Babeliales bacterium]
MKLKKAAAVKTRADKPLKIILTIDERKRVAAYFAALIIIDKRLNPKKTKKAKRKTNEAKSARTECGPLFLLRTHLSLCYHLRIRIMDVQQMIDTVILRLSKDRFSINNPDKFQPSARWILDNAANPGIKSIQNPTKKELHADIYKPHLTLSNRINSSGAFEPLLKIELSLAKLFFGNNFDELKSKDFTPLIQKLGATLQEMGIETTTKQLSQAPLAGIHYSKNIPLTDGSTPYHFINKIKEANVKLSLDVNQTDYRNEGHSYKWHCNSYEIAFYDKIRDLEKAKLSSKRAIEKDSELQLNLFDRFATRRKLEFLRMEVRLNKREKIKKLFKSLNIKSDLSFKSLFKPTISKKILLHYLDEIESKRSVLIDYKGNDKSLLAALLINNPDLNTKQILQIFGLKKALEVMSARELRSRFAKCHQRSWYRLMADVNKINLPSSQNPFGVIREQLSKFKPLRLASI